jgi:tetratricopeptide (TPR) repeat protein
LPYSGVTRFVGRDKDLEGLHQQLQTESTIAISAISGMGGIGKTELAWQYADRHRQSQDYPGGVVWLKAREDIATQIVSFAQTHLQIEPRADLELLQKVAVCWQRWPEGKVLVVLDDVQNYARLKPVLPPPGSRFKVLLTTRSRLQLPVQDFEIKVLSEDAAIALLQAIVGEQDLRLLGEVADLKRICKWLDYLPLGLELVGRYLARKPDISLATLWQRLQDKGLDAQALKQSTPEMTALLGVAAAFELSWAGLSQSAQQLAGLLSLFALAEIPWALVEALVEACLPDWDAEALEDWRDAELMDWHLLQRTGENQYQLHQLLHAFFTTKRAEMPTIATLQPQFFEVMLAEARRSTETPAQSLIQETAIVMPHLQAAITWAESANQTLEMALGQAWLAGLYYSQGRYAEAEPLYRRSLQIREQQLGAEHPDTATSLNNLALLYRSQGRYAEAEPLYRRSLEILTATLGFNHPNTRTGRANLANLYDDMAAQWKLQGHYDKVVEYLEHAIALRETQDLGGF